MTPVRWGVLSTSSFAENSFIPSLRKCASIEVGAVASRDLSRSRAFAERNAIPTAYGSYEELIADPTIEVVYNPLPNHLHAEWTLRAAEAGKHVLCEKPMGLHERELQVLMPLAEHVHIAEGFMVRFHPQWIETRARVRNFELGRVTNMHVMFGYNNADEANIRNIASAGGGALYDIGCYAIAASRWFLESEPVRVAAVTDVDPKFGTDRLTSALLDFGDGRTSTFSVSTQSVRHQRVHIIGTKGRLEITIPFNQPTDEPAVYLFHDGQSADGLDAVRNEVPIADQYALQAEAFSARVRYERPTAAPLRDAMLNARVIEAVQRSAATRQISIVGT